jgi:hypothetical protein
MEPMFEIKKADVGTGYYARRKYRSGPYYLRVKLLGRWRRIGGCFRSRHDAMRALDDLGVDVLAEEVIGCEPS